MRLKPRTLRVYPNPWGVPPKACVDKSGKLLDPKDVKVDVSRVTIDGEGRPRGMCPVDAFEHDPRPGLCVGSSLDPKRTKRGEELAKGDDLRSRRQTTVRSYLKVSAEDPELALQLAAKEAVTIPYTHYYRDQIRKGDLIAGDKATADFCKAPYVAPLDLFPVLEAVAVKAFDAQFSDVPGGAFAHFRRERAEQAKADTAPKQASANEQPAPAPPAGDKNDAPLEDGKGKKGKGGS